MIKNLIENLLSRLFPYHEVNYNVTINDWERFQTKALEDYWCGSPGRGFNFKEKGE